MKKIGSRKEKKASNIDIEYVSEKLQDCPDIIQKKVYINNEREAFFFYVNGLSDKV